MEGYYKFVNGEWAHAPNGIILPYTNELTMDNEVMGANGWKWYDDEPEKLETFKVTGTTLT
jgi:hypothetical protein